MKLYRYELFCDEEPQDVGFLVGLADLGLSDEMEESLMYPFDSLLEIPDLPAMRGSASFFTEEGNARFQMDIFRVATAYQGSMFDIKLCTLELPKEYLNQVVYQDENQVCLPRRLYCEELNNIVSREYFPAEECLDKPVQDVALTKEKENSEMTRTSLKLRIEELKAAARELGGELLVDESDFHGKDHLHCLWYDSGQVGSFVYKGFCCSVEVAGDVSLSVWDKDFDDVIYKYRKPAMGGAYEVPEALGVFKNDRVLEKMLDDGRIVFGMNNWVALRIFDEDDNSYDVDITLDDNVLEALGDFETFVKVVDGILREKVDEKPLVAVLEHATARSSITAGEKAEKGEKELF